MSNRLNDLKKSVITMNARYYAGLVGFKKRCSDHSSIMEFVSAIFERNDCNIKESIQSKQEVRAIDIGYGNGIITAHLAKLLLQTTGGEVSLDLLEPGNDHVDITKERIGPLMGQRLKINFIQQKAEDYFANIPAETYDLVFASHSLHLIPLKALPRIAVSVKRGGCLIAVIGARDSIMSELKDLFVPAPAITGKDVLQGIKECDIGGEFKIKLESRPSILDLEGVSFTENKNDMGNAEKNLISLMVQKNIDDVDQAGYARARQIILRHLKNNRLRLENDAMVFWREKKIL